MNLTDLRKRYHVIVHITYVRKGFKSCPKVPRIIS